jgi:hypothetical protein
MHDLRSINLGDKNIASFALKRDAVAFAKSKGWPPKAAQQAHNRFCIFWVVAQQQPSCLRILTKNDGWFDLPST